MSIFYVVYFYGLKVHQGLMKPINQSISRPTLQSLLDFLTLI